MPSKGCIHHVPYSALQASENSSIPHIAGKGLIAMRVTQVVFAASIAILGLTLVLHQAAAEPRLEAKLGEGPHRVYLPMIATSAGPAKKSSTNVPNAVISVAARAGLSCEDGETVPVNGARITVMTDHTSRIGLTDESGYALFTATTEPAVIQIEWPVGFLPCPNSRPVVELPDGVGEVEFTAVASH